MSKIKTTPTLPKSNGIGHTVKLYWDLVREDGRLERTCKHGIGHTVGDLNPERLKNKYHGVHGCDGCCADWPRQGSDE